MKARTKIALAVLVILAATAAPARTGDQPADVKPATQQTAELKTEIRTDAAADSSKSAADTALSVDPFVGANQVTTTAQAICQLCISPICTTPGADCGNGSCCCKTCNGEFNCWKKLRGGICTFIP